jgi:hypothetical protein
MSLLWPFKFIHILLERKKTIKSLFIALKARKGYNDSKTGSYASKANQMSGSVLIFFRVK